ncbi:MAG TPA: transporter [Prolixibacteraceae bacterium]|nr:transporter [Prolixibacteraceae bacterium]
MLLLLLLFLTAHIQAQTEQPISIDSCYAKARRNYPLIKQFGLIEKSKSYSLDNVSKGYLPQVTVAGQATYQSDVTQLALNENLSGMLNFEPISKDQYKLYGEVVQPITDLFTLSNQKDLVDINAGVEAQKIEVELYRLYERIDQLFFGMLLVELQIEQNEIVKKDIIAGIEKTKAAIANGTSLKSNLSLLKAELLKAEQRTTELKAGWKSYADMLSLFTRETITTETKLQKPPVPQFSNAINRPELQLYELQKNAFDVQSNIVNTKNLPRFSLFFQGGAGRPALNFLSNNFDMYYFTGLRLNWNISSFYTSGKEKDILQFNRESVELQKETFLFNTNLTVQQQINETAKTEALIKTDEEIIALREEIKNTARNQLENGTISAIDYVSYVNAEDQARQNLLLHQVQLLMVLYNNKTTTGNHN